jgi:hypothetical protein
MFTDIVVYDHARGRYGCRKIQAQAKRGCLRGGLCEEDIVKWVTRNYVHLDRVACPWLIKRFIDPDAKFIFVPWGKEDERPTDAIPFAIPGVELGPHDAQGTTFQKLLTKYKLNDPALNRMAKVIAGGVDYVLHNYRSAPDENHGQMAIGLLAISDGIMLIKESDDQVIEASLVIYDALYANFKAYALLEAKGEELPPRGGRGPAPKTEFLRALLKGARV